MKGVDPRVERRDDGPHGPDPRGTKPHAVSATFQSAEEVQHALEQLVRSGVPRDLIEIVVSPEAATTFYPDTARKPGRDALRLAGAGGLIGLIVGSIISLVLIMLPGFFDEGIIPYVQLIGPNFVTVVGAMIGALVGIFRGIRPNPNHARATEEPDAIVIVITLRSREEAKRVVDILDHLGGTGPRIES